VEGLTHLLSFVPGDFAVVIHSEPDCANLVLRDSRAVDPGRFFCSNLSEADAIAGGGRARLAGAVREAIAARRPSAIFVVGGCVAGLAGDDIAGITASLRLPRGIRVVALDGGAFRTYGQAETIDRLTAILVDAAPRRARKAARSVGLVGFAPDDGEAATILGRAGITVRAWPQLDSPREEWSALAGAALTVVSDASLFAALVTRLATRHRVPSIGLGPPLGIDLTRRWYEGIIGRLDARRRMSAFARELAEARAATAAFRRRHGRRRLAFHVGGRKDFEWHTLVRGGLAAAPLFRELGFEVELLFQGAVEERQRRRIDALLAHHGLGLPYRCLPDRLSLTRALRSGRHAVVYCSDSLREEAGAAGVPILPIGSLLPGFAGTAANCARLDALTG
jgi:nitrogenase molybdenum-iron protein alpha/beta subunit